MKWPFNQKFTGDTIFVRLFVFCNSIRAIAERNFASTLGKDSIRRHATFAQTREKKR
jgi:hypothetical protein